MDEILCKGYRSKCTENKIRDRGLKVNCSCQLPIHALLDQLAHPALKGFLVHGALFVEERTEWLGGVCTPFR